MSDPTPNSVSFPINPDSNDKRPLPEIIADHYGFALAYVDHTDGKRYYAVQDWIVGVAKTDNPSRFWTDLRRYAKNAGVELYVRHVKLPRKGKNGKSYQMDYVRDEDLYRITQRMRSETGLRDQVLDFLAKAGVVIDEMRIDPDVALEMAFSGYKREGNSVTRIEIRIRGKMQRLLFTAAVAGSLREPAQPRHFAIITNAMRLGLWKRDTATLKTQMGLKEKDNLRDHQSEIALTYELLAEQISTRRLEQKRSLDFEEARRIVYKDAEFVGRQAAEAGRELGIDIATDRPLLADTTDDPKVK